VCKKIHTEKRREDMGDLFEYKCPCCGGAISFNSTAQKMKCPYCGTEFEMETLKAMDEELKAEQPESMEWDMPDGDTFKEDETAHMRVYTCQSCGGEIVGDENLGSSRCPYCDSTIVMKGMFAGDLKPDYVIPFKIDRNAAKEGLGRHLKGKRLLPKVFKDENHIDEIKGLYVPFWMFDSKADANARYDATKVKRWSDARYEYTETSYYSVSRAGNLLFENVPADGSSKMDDDLMESVEPFDFKGAVPFQTAYLAGYLADKYDVTAEENVDRVNARIKKSTEDVFRNTVQGYDTVNTVNCNVRLQGGKVKYVLCPVWILNTTWKGEKYVFAMNGQTGKFVGNLPLDKGAYRRWLFGLTGLYTVIAFLISLLFFVI